MSAKVKRGGHGHVNGGAKRDHCGGVKRDRLAAAGYRDIASEFEQGYDCDPAYRPHIGHMIKRPEWGKKTEQIPQAGGILRWEDSQPKITLLIYDYTFPMTFGPT